jgi:hypothetical protein
VELIDMLSVRAYSSPRQQKGVERMRPTHRLRKPWILVLLFLLGAAVPVGAQVPLINDFDSRGS